MCYNIQEQLFRTVQFTHLYAFRNRFEKYTSRGDTVVKKEMIAMLLAGGQGSRLGVLTSKVAKPAVAFGGKYRIIDFPLSNCINSGIDTSRRADTVPAASIEYAYRNRNSVGS